MELSGIAANCDVSGATRLGVTITANGVAGLAFAITCRPTTGSIQVTTSSGDPSRNSPKLRGVSHGIH